jgi:molybdate transport system substrate-binding protein
MRRWLSTQPLMRGVNGTSRMTIDSSIKRGGVCVVLALLLARSVLAQVPNADPAMAQKVADAKPGDLRVMATATISAPLQLVRAEAEKVVGRTVVIQYGSARGNLKNAILAGQEFDVALLLPDVNAELLAKDKILPQRRLIAQVPIAIALRGDVAPPDISTPEALKAALLGAKSVKYGPTGVARDTVDKVLGTLGVTDAVKDSSKLDRFSDVPLAPGEYELNIYPLSEILVSKKSKNLGPVPAPLQVPGTIEAVISKRASDRQAAETFIKFLAGPAIDPALAKSGMTRAQ